jgi:eukaryotic-like serine/threonine-protein kinase
MAIDHSTPTILGNRYHLIHQVGKGGMALVYQGYDQMLERPVAIKVLREDFLSDPSFRERFQQEAKSAANLAHPNIVTIYDFGFDDNSLFIVMEFVRGTDLKSKIRHHGIFSVEEGIPLVLQACAGLGYAHRAGIVHCDVKPHNMLVTPDNRLKITDFGIARALSTIDPQEKQEVVWGSPQYISPEQSQGSAPSPASDVYSLGVVIYEMFTGHLPFETDDPEELASLRINTDPIPPHTYNPQIPAALEQIILKVLSREPSQRYRTADQLGRVLLSLGQQPDKYFLVPPPIIQKTSQETQNNNQTFPPPSISYEDEISTEPTMDWKTILLELTCILFVGGLIPFWLFVWFSIKPLLH